ncbi:Serpin peptidase inhibitor, clade B (Ovalbumin), member [Chamberlinius hualienensis]
MNALGMLTLGSSGRTATQLKDVLRFNPIARGIGDTFHQGLGLENKKLISDKSSMFAVGNRFFVDGGSASNINPDFLSELSRYYNSSMQVVPFNSNPNQARQTINDWVSASTFGKLDNFFPSNLDPLTKLILVNTMYFNGQWVLQFNESLTKNGNFQTPLGPVNVPFMNLTGPLHYARDDELGVETVVLPYTGFNYAMHIILPTSNMNLDTLEAQLNADNIVRLSKSTRQTPVVLTMPKFSLKQRLSLKDMLSRLGVNDVFDPFKGDFSGIFVQSRPGLLVDDVIHEALVEVSEKGTIASAATGIVVVRIAQRTKFITIDRPFIFYISDESNGTILFWGRVSNPSST